MEKKRLSWQNKEGFEAAVSAIESGKVGIGDTDTIPGFFTACTSQGVAQLNALKGRSDKPYLLLVGSRDALVSFIKQPISFQIETLIKKYWPGPLTLIFPAREDVPSYLQSKNGGIAIRIPEHEKIRELALRCKGVLSTSANFTGQPSPETLDDVDSKIKGIAAFELYDEVHKGNSKPSTILDVTGDSIRVIREGALPIQELEACVGAPFIR